MARVSDWDSVQGMLHDWLDGTPIPCLSQKNFPVVVTLQFYIATVEDILLAHLPDPSITKIAKWPVGSPVHRRYSGAAAIVYGPGWLD